MSTIQEIINYYQTCCNIQQTADYFNEERTYISRLLNKLGIKANKFKPRIKNKYTDTLEYKTCRSCKAKKLRDNFSISNNTPDKYKTYCKECANKKYLLRKYNLTLEQYNKLAILQNYTCAICKMNFCKINKLCVDHSHKTNKIRGLICQPCNLLLSNANDNPQTLRNGADYLENPPGNILY